MENKEPNKLIIIGNGFDLAHGLETSYSHFMLWVINFEYRKLFNKQPLTGIFEQNPNPQTTWFTRGGHELDSLDTFRNKSDIGKDLLFKNKFFKHILDKQLLQNWVDIEGEFYKLLVSTFNRQYKIPNYTICNLNFDFEQIKQLLEKYLIDIKDKPFTRIIKISTLFKSLPKYDKTKTIPPVLICNFNYTSTFDSYIRNDTDMDYDDICFIHGEIERTENPIIFGFGDEKEKNYLPMESSKNDNYLKYIKSFAYLKTSYYSKLLSFIDAEKFEVVIMGHSCGQSDRVLLKTIFEHDNCEKIIIKYYERPDGTNDFDEKAKEIARSFSDKALFRKRVVHYQDDRVTSLV